MLPLTWPFEKSKPQYPDPILWTYVSELFRTHELLSTIQIGRKIRFQRFIESGFSGFPKNTGQDQTKSATLRIHPQKLIISQYPDFRSGSKQTDLDPQLSGYTILFKHYTYSGIQSNHHDPDPQSRTNA